MTALKSSFVGAALFLTLFGLSACTSSGDSAEPTAEAAQEANNQGTDPFRSEEIFKNQESTLKRDGRPLEILQQVRAKGSTTIEVAALPEKYTQLGVAVQCAGNSQWNTRFADDGLEAWGDCSLNPGAASLVDVTEKDRGYTVEVEVLNEADTQLWVTVYAKPSK